MRRIAARLSEMSEPSSRVMGAGVKLSCTLMLSALTLFKLAAPLSLDTYQIYKLAASFRDFAFPIMLISLIMSAVIEERACC